ncbi:MAG: rhomboid family intramembrane serine protease [Bacteroidia bacterium]|nr:rhomboid family intramembrane serine protease [Bacteroidia bacterium]
MIWLIKILETLLEVNLAAYGLFPRQVSGLLGIVTAPFLHGDYLHLISNTLPVFLLSTFSFYAYPRVAVPLTVWLFLATGLWTWSFARDAYHIGASGLVYGYASFLFFSGWFRREREAQALSLVVVFLYSGLLLGLVPADNHISWESHLSGSVAGLGFAYFFRQTDVPQASNLHPEAEAWSEEENHEIRLNHIFYTPPNSSQKRQIWPK